MVMLEQIRVVNKADLLGYVGTLRDEVIKAYMLPEQGGITPLAEAKEFGK